MADDAELLIRYVADRSEAAFAELVRRHADLVYSAALRQTAGDPHRAKDITQMVFIALARKAAVLVHHPVLSAWLHRTVVLQAADARRREGRRQKYERTAGAEEHRTIEIDGELAWEAVRPMLDEVINDLSEPDRRAIFLRYFSNCPFAEVGRQLGLSENAARMRVERALAKLHALLGRRGIKSAPAALAAMLTSHAVMAAPTGVVAAMTAAALTGAGTSTAVWIAFMTSSKLPLALTAVLVLGGAGVGVWQEQASRRTARELAALERDDRWITSLKAQNQQLLESAAQVRNLREDEANLDALRERVRKTEAEAAKRERTALQLHNLANSPARSARTLPLDSAQPVLDASKLDQMPNPRRPVAPIYPIEMRNAGIPGQVIVDIVVGVDGSVYNAFAASSTQSDFETAAVQAVSQWTFTPGQKNGQTVNTHLQIPINFTPGKPPASDAFF